MQLKEHLMFILSDPKCFNLILYKTLYNMRPTLLNKNTSFVITENISYQYYNGKTIGTYMDSITLIYNLG